MFRNEAKLDAEMKAKVAPPAVFRTRAGGRKFGAIIQLADDSFLHGVSRILKALAQAGTLSVAISRTRAMCAPTTSTIPSCYLGTA